MGCVSRAGSLSLLGSRPLEQKSRGLPPTLPKVPIWVGWRGNGASDSIGSSPQISSVPGRAGARTLRQRFASTEPLRRNATWPILLLTPLSHKKMVEQKTQPSSARLGLPPAGGGSRTRRWRSSRRSLILSGGGGSALGVWGGRQCHLAVDCRCLGGARIVAPPMGAPGICVGGAQLAGIVRSRARTWTFDTPMLTMIHFSAPARALGLISGSRAGLAEFGLAGSKFPDAAPAQSWIQDKGFESARPAS